MNYAQAFFLYATATKLFDALTVFLVWQFAWALRFQSAWIPAPKGIPEADPYNAAAFPLVAVFTIVFHVVGAYRSDRIPLGFRPLKKLAQGCLLGTMVFVSLLYFTGEVHFSRAFLSVFAGAVFVALVAERIMLHGVWRAAQGRIRHLRILLLGHGNLLSLYVEKICAANPYPITWVGRLGPPSAEPADLPYLGTESGLPSLLAERKVDGVVLSYPPEEDNRYAPLLQALSKELVDVKVVPDFGRDSTFNYRADHECGIPLLTFNRAPTSVTDRAFKRLFDVVGSLGLLAVFSPVFGVLSLLVKLTSRGPVFYGQKRMGADGRVFTLYKFRSMGPDAESETGPVWAKAADDRATAVGRWMRRTSLDEIPQFYNVLRGDMSLVGPRPERPMFVDQFRHEVPRYMLRHKMKSGITGWAQVNGWRGDTSLEERIRHDLYYIGHWSHLFDIKILALTMLRGFVHRNAY